MGQRYRKTLHLYKKIRNKEIHDKNKEFINSGLTLLFTNSSNVFRLIYICNIFFAPISSVHSFIQQIVVEHFSVARISRHRHYMLFRVMLVSVIS